MAIVIMAMVIFVGISTTVVKAKDNALKEMAEQMLADEFDKNYEEELGYISIFVKERTTKATLSDDFKTCTVDTVMLLDKDIIGEDHDIELEYVITVDTLAKEILSYECYYDGEFYDVDELAYEENIYTF
jgi:hypothetical protein